MLGFSQCSSTKELQSEAPIAIGKVFYQKWIAGIEGGGSGLNIFIPVNDTSIALDSVFFRGKAAKLETKSQDQSLYIGRFISQFNKRRDLIMSSDSIAEYGNKLPIVEQKIPFELQSNECVVSYIDGLKTKYFKINNVVEKASLHFPMAPKQ